MREREREIRFVKQREERGRREGGKEGREEKAPESVIP
jgi:hypothetical protein